PRRAGRYRRGDQGGRRRTNDGESITTNLYRRINTGESITERAPAPQRGALSADPARFPPAGMTAEPQSRPARCRSTCIDGRINLRGAGLPPGWRVTGNTTPPGTMPNW